MNPVNRQDVQNIVEVAKNRIMDRMVTKQDIVALTDTVKNLAALHQQSQQIVKQSEYQQSQLSRRIVSLEAKISGLENDTRVMAATVARSMEQRQPQQIIMPVQTQADEKAMRQAAQYVYRPA